jgi:hypothetical protein
VPRNPFVSLVSLASGAPLSSVRPGYIVTREGVHLAAGGYVGFGWNGRLSSGCGGVAPGLSYAP